MMKVKVKKETYLLPFSTSFTLFYILSVSSTSDTYADTLQRNTCRVARESRLLAITTHLISTENVSTFRTGSPMEKRYTIMMNKKQGVIDSGASSINNANGS